MEMCKHETVAIRIAPRTLPMIHTLDASVTLQSMEENFFMIYCVDSDHEAYQTIDEFTFKRTYGPMPEQVIASHVKTID